jgi:hypothetical protein
MHTTPIECNVINILLLHSCSVHLTPCISSEHGHPIKHSCPHCETQRVICCMIYEVPIGDTINLEPRAWKQNYLRDTDDVGDSTLNKALHSPAMTQPAPAWRRLLPQTSQTLAPRPPLAPPGQLCQHSPVRPVHTRQAIAAIKVGVQRCGMGNSC